MRFRQIPSLTYNEKKQVVSLASMKTALQRTSNQIRHGVKSRTAAMGLNEKGVLYTQPIVLR